MSNQLACPHCQGGIVNDVSLAGRSVKCPHCRGQFLMPVAQAIPIEQERVPCLSTRMPEYHSHIERSPPRSPGLAAVLSFLYCGLGQIYNGQFGKGFLFMIMPLAASGMFLLGFLGDVAADRDIESWAPLLIMIGIVWLAFWAYQILDAYHYAEKLDRRRR